MRIRERCVLPALFSACLIVASICAAGRCIAREQPAPQGIAKPSSSSGTKTRAKKLRAELSDVDKTWLMEEVPYIISDDERRAFLELGTAEEREQFIEIYWRSRNPDPESPLNPVREEHYRRLRYGDEHFASRVPAPETDRRRHYIISVPPDKNAAPPIGGTFHAALQRAPAIHR